MKLPVKREERWSLMKHLIREWFRPLTSDDCLTQQELNEANKRFQRLLESQKAASSFTPVQLPLALQEWYQLAGRATDVWSRNHQLCLPDQVDLNCDVLVFYVENQDVVEWGIPLKEINSDDPPVVVIDTGAGFLTNDKYTTANRSTSEFAIQMLLHNVKHSKTVWARACGPGMAATHDAIGQHYDRVELPDWVFPPASFFIGPDTLIETEGNEDGNYVYVTAKTDRAFGDFERLVVTAGDEWQEWSKNYAPWL